MTDSPHKRLVQHRKEEIRLCCQDFFYFAQFVSTEDEELQSIRPFPIHFNYLHKINHEIDTHQKVIILKSRRMLVSWLGVLRQLWQAWRAGQGLPDCPDVFRGAISSTDQDHAYYLIERATKAYFRLPDWMRDQNPLAVDNKLLLRFEKGGMMQAFAAKREGAQGYGFSEYLFDEMAWQEAARTAWAGLLPTLGAEGKMLAVSTPNGKLNFFSDVWHNKGDHFTDIHRATLHWTQNPEHDEVWYKKATAGLTDQQIQALYELSFSHYAGDRVWPKFERRTHVVEETEVIIGRPMLIGWDFGFHNPAVVFAQKNSLDQFVGHREFNGYDIEFGEFVKQTKEFANTFYDRRNFPELHFVDPAGFHRYSQRAASGAANDVHEIKLQFGESSQIRPGAMQTKSRDNEGPRLKVVRQLWNLRADSRPGAIVNERMKVFVEGCLGGYAYPEKGGEDPLKNEFSHGQDAWQYLATGHKTLVSPDKAKQKQTKKYRRISPRLGT